MNNKILTLCIIEKHGRILLGMKKRGFGTGRWNGFGGKVQDNESIKDGAEREIFEETSLTAKSLSQVGTIIFKFEDGTGIHEVHVFRCSDFEGQEKESEEMKPQWFNVNQIPYENMWPADSYWLPYLIGGKNFKAT